MSEANGTPDDFNLDAWIDGTCGMTKRAKIYQRGDLFAEMDRLEAEIEVAKEIPKEERGANDKTTEQLRDELDRVVEQLSASALVVHVQDRTEERRRKIRERLVKENKLDPSKDDDAETIVLHTVADAIVKIEHNGHVKPLPDGFPVNRLRELRDRLGDSGLFAVKDAFFKVISEAPSVSAPLSRRSSSGRGGVT